MNHISRLFSLFFITSITYQFFSIVWQIIVRNRSEERNIDQCRFYSRIRRLWAFRFLMTIRIIWCFCLSFWSIKSFFENPPENSAIELIRFYIYQKLLLSWFMNHAYLTILSIFNNSIFFLFFYPQWSSVSSVSFNIERKRDCSINCLHSILYWNDYQTDIYHYRDGNVSINWISRLIFSPLEQSPRRDLTIRFKHVEMKWIIILIWQIKCW